MSPRFDADLSQLANRLPDREAGIEELALLLQDSRTLGVAP